MSYKLDKIAYTSQFNVYQMYESWVVPLQISGTVAAGTTKYYGAGFNFTGSPARGNVSIQRHDTGLRAPFNAGERLSRSSPTYIIFQTSGSEIIRTETTYPTATTFQVILYIDNNTGSPINLISQQVDIIIDFYIPPVGTP